MANQIDEEEPLDPVMEKVRVKMVRLLVVSIGVMVIALMTVLGAIVYKISQGNKDKGAEVEKTTLSSDSSEKVAPVSLRENIELDLPEGSSILSSNLVGNRLVIDVRLNDGQRQFWIVDLQTGAISRVTTK